MPDPLSISIDGTEGRGHVLQADPGSHIVILALEAGELLDNAVEHMTMPPLPPLVDDDGVAESPIPAYPGRLRFKPFNARLYRVVTQTLAKQEEDWPEDNLKLLPYWRVACAIADIELEGVDTGAPFDEQPVEILPWLKDATQEYVDRFLTYRRRRV